MAASGRARPPTASSDDPVEERSRARDSKRRGLEASRGGVRRFSGRSEVSNPEEKRLERELVLADILEREADSHRLRLSADDLASLSRFRSSPTAVRERARESLLAASKQRPEARTQPAGDEDPRRDDERREVQDPHRRSQPDDAEEHDDAARRRPGNHEQRHRTRTSRKARKAVGGDDRSRSNPTRLPNIPTALHRGYETPLSRPLSTTSLDGPPDDTPRVNPYLQEVRPTTPLGADASAVDMPDSISVSLLGRFRPPSPLHVDAATGKVQWKRHSRPASAASDETDFSQSALANVRREFMNPMSVHLTPLGAVFNEASEGSDDSMMLHSDDEDEVTEVYLDQVLDDPVPADQVQFEPCTPSSSSAEESESSRSATPQPDKADEEEVVLSEDEAVPAEATASRTFVPGLSIEVNRDILRVSRDLAGCVDDWQRSITRVLDLENTVAEVERVSARIPGVVVLQVVFRNTEALTEHEAQNAFSRVNSGASSKSGGKGKGWQLLRRASSVSNAVKNVKTDASGDAAFNRVDSNGSFVRISSQASVSTGFVLKGSAAKRVRNDCMSRDPHVWQEAIHHYVDMRAVQVELLLPRGTEAALMPPPIENTTEVFNSLVKGALVEVTEGTPRLGVLAAGSRSGAGTVISATQGQRPASEGAMARPWLASVWWHDTGLVTNHSSDISSADDLSVLAAVGSVVRVPSINSASASSKSLGGGQTLNSASSKSLGGGLRDHARNLLLSMDWLRVFPRALGVHIKAEPGLLVRRRRRHRHQHHHQHGQDVASHDQQSPMQGSSWALEEPADAVLQFLTPYAWADDCLDVCLSVCLVFIIPPHFAFYACRSLSVCTAVCTSVCTSVCLKCVRSSFSLSLCLSVCPSDPQLVCSSRPFYQRLCLPNGCTVAVGRGLRLHEHYYAAAISDCRMCMCICMHVYVYLYVCVCVCVCPRNDRRKYIVMSDEVLALE